MVSPIYKKCDNLTFLNLESNSRAFQILSDLPERRCTDIWPSLFTIRILWYDGFIRKFGSVEINALQGLAKYYG